MFRPSMSLRRSAAVVAFAFGLLALTACKPPSNEPKAYDEVTEANFIEGCTGVVTEGTVENPSTSIVTTDGASSGVCKCEYDWFVANVPFDQKTAATSGQPDQVNFQDLNQQLQDDPTSMPQEIQDGLKSACSEHVTPATTGQTASPGAPSDTAVDTTTP
jgi:hypothetical protein